MKCVHLVRGATAVSLGLLVVSLSIPVKSYAGVSPLINEGNCPQTNNACNNADGCDPDLNDLGFWVHWYPMRRNDQDLYYQKCKDRYSEVKNGGTCSQGDFQATFREYGCASNGNP